MPPPCKNPGAPYRQSPLSPDRSSSRFGSRRLSPGTRPTRRTADAVAHGPVQTAHRWTAGLAPRGHSRHGQGNIYPCIIPPPRARVRVEPRFASCICQAHALGDVCRRTTSAWTALPRPLSSHVSPSALAATTDGPVPIGNLALGRLANQQRRSQDRRLSRRPRGGWSGPGFMLVSGWAWVELPDVPS